MVVFKQNLKIVLCAMCSGLLDYWSIGLLEY